MFFEDENVMMFFYLFDDEWYELDINSLCVLFQIEEGLLDDVVFKSVEKVGLCIYCIWLGLLVFNDLVVGICVWIVELDYVQVI